MSKTKKTRIYTHHNLTELRKHRITLMIKFGGFSYRAIAQRILGTPFEVDSDEAMLERSAIQSFAHREGLKVTDWRNGMSLAAQSHIRGMMDVKNSLKKQLAKKAKK